MLTKGIIKRLNTIEDNHFSVYIPFLRKASMDESDATFEATAIYTLGIRNNYSVGDVVYLDFEDGSWDKPVIVGRLLKVDEDESTTTISCSTLEVLNKAKIQNSVSIEGIDLGLIKEKLSALEQIVNTLDSGSGWVTTKVNADNEELGIYWANLRVKVNSETETADFIIG